MYGYDISSSLYMLYKVALLLWKSVACGQIRSDVHNRFFSRFLHGLKHVGTYLCLPMGQSFLLQLSLSLAFPIHLLPPYWGRGLLHSRVLVLIPPPHVTEQVAHGDQGPQPPSTNKTHKKKWKWKGDAKDIKNSNFWIFTHFRSKSDNQLHRMWSLMLGRETG